MAPCPAQETYRRVLIVEDDDAQRWTLTGILEEEGLDVTACASATEALEHLRHDNIRVVVLDLRLPDLTGVQLLNRLGDRADNTSIIINTAHSSYESAKDALNLGAFAYVEKAGDPEELLRQVHRAIAFQLRRHAERLEATVAERADELKEANRALRQEIAERREAEMAVRESETRFRELVELLPQIVIETDSSGRITFVNHFGQDSFGGDSHELAERHIHDLFAPEDRERLTQNLQKRLSGKRLEDHEYLALHADGTTFPVLLYSSRIVRDGQPVGLRCIAVDISDRRAAEIALQQSKAKPESIFESSPDAITVTDLDLRIEDCNPAMLQMFALPSKDHILGTSMVDFIARQDHERARQTVAQVRQDGSVQNIGLTLVRRDGREFPSEISASLMRDVSGRSLGFVIITSDITDRKRAEDALRESERKLSTLMANLPGMAYRCLADDQWTMLFVSQGCAALTGYASDALIGNQAISYDQIIHPDDRRQVHDQINQALRAGAAFEIEYRIVTADGRQKWVWERGRQVDGAAGSTGVLEGFILDVSERKQAEEALRTVSRQWQTTFDSVSDVMWLLDGQSRIQRCNRATADLFGGESNRILGRHCWEVVHGSRGPIAECPIVRMQQTRHRESMSLRIGNRWYEITVDPILGPSGVLEGAVHIMSDITEWKEANEELLAYQRKLKSIASELALTEERERRRIAADLHDHACQSLALSKMRLQEMLEHADPTYARALRNICETLNATIESVRELTFDLSSPTLYKFGLEAALEELLEDKLRAEHHIQYRFSDDHAPKPLSQDVLVLLFQSVRELLINVIKHAYAHEVTLDIRRQIDCIRVVVADDGVGFDVDEVLSSPSRGRSVGLFNIRERLDYIGGRLDIDSAPGRGSRFVLIAPLKTEVHATKESHDGGENSAR
ncbi:MAG TPA: PAS domain S-box protein [Sedimentisphaerales bacterium]|nr:PAS domain S-box protein [Sedimentisphaerales bacterium]HRS11059.1 PAS domain S-box protein [Sedimentisphaerales bacterium]HRV47733.1 PAS domain S-box protein [Sedimentisphaerales bacterium]